MHRLTAGHSNSHQGGETSNGPARYKLVCLYQDIKHLVPQTKLFQCSVGDNSIMLMLG